MSAKPWLSETISVPEAICRVFEEAGIDVVFGIPGGNTGQIFDALYDHQKRIRTVLVRHESLSGVMAEVYGKLTGKPGVVMGQGAWMLANAALGILEGYLGSSPMLVIGEQSDGAPHSNHAPYQAGTGEYGNWDAKASFTGITKYVMAPHQPAQAVQNTQLAIKHALSGQRGPVALLYHSEALAGKVGPDSQPRLYATQHYLPAGPLAGDPAQVDAAANLLVRAERPVIVAGNGVRIANAYAQLQRLSETLGAAVVTTAAGKGVFAETNDLALGLMGNFGLKVANALVAEADVVLVVGSKLGPTDTAHEHPQLLDPTRQTFIQVDVEPKNASWTFPCERVVIGDAAMVLEQLDAAVQHLGAPSNEVRAQRKAWVAAGRQKYGFFNDVEMLSNESPILPQRIIREIQQAVAEDAIITCDAGENRIFMNHFFQTKGPGTFLQAAAVGGMGYAIPAALGAKVVFPNRQVVAVTGDGGFAMAMNGLMTAREQNLPIVTVVFNNRALGWVKHGMGDRAIAADFQDFDFGAMARSMGVNGVRVEHPEDLGPALRKALASGQPTVVDVVTSLKESFRRVVSPLIRPPESV